MATAALNIEVGRGREIVLAFEEFPSGVLIWREVAARTGARIVTVDRPADGDWTAAMENRSAPIRPWSSRARPIGFAAVYTDLPKIGARCREVGAALVVDATQSVGAMPIDIREVDPDFPCGAGYKWLLAPYSTRISICRPSPPAGAANRRSLASRREQMISGRSRIIATNISLAARRFDGGERANFASLPGAIAALEQLLAWTPERDRNRRGIVRQDHRGRCAVWLERTSRSLPIAALSQPEGEPSVPRGSSGALGRSRRLCERPRRPAEAQPACRQ